LGDYTILQEYNVGSRLRVDYVLKELSTAFEVQGSQHSDFSSLFHDSKDALRAAKQRDQKKAELCAEHGLKLITLDYPVIMRCKSPEELLAIILQEMNGKTQEESDEW
jgi:very-short-patch-repair endonuclease